MRRHLHRKQPPLRKRKKQPQNILYLPRWILSKRAKVAVGLFSVFLGVIGWHLNTCMLERRNRLQEYKRASRKSRIANEKTLQAMLTYNSTEEGYANYLTQDSVQIKEIKIFHGQFASMAKDMNDNCNSLIAALDEEQDALHELTRYYDLKDVGLAQGGSSCRGLRELVDDLHSNVDSDDLTRLAQDKALRIKLSKAEQSNVEGNMRTTENARQFSMHSEKHTTELIASLEHKEASWFWAIWHCLHGPF